MHRLGSKKEREERERLARENLERTPIEKGDFLAMVIAAFITLLPVIIIILVAVSILLFIMFT